MELEGALLDHQAVQAGPKQLSPISDFIEFLVDIP
jgi:hypothetical protein